MIDKTTPAFPLQETEDYRGQEGMSLRDYFAAKAINAFLEDVGWKVEADLFADIAEGAYRMADAMMEARK